jgi:hypothetical protein
VSDNLLERRPIETGAWRGRRADLGRQAEAAKRERDEERMERDGSEGVACAFE